MHRGVYRRPRTNVTLKQLLRYTAEGIISLIRGEEAEMLSSKNYIQLRHRGYIHIPHTTPLEEKKRMNDLQDLFK